MYVTKGTPGTRFVPRGAVKDIQCEEHWMAVVFRFRGNESFVGAKHKGTAEINCWVLDKGVDRPLIPTASEDFTKTSIRWTVGEKGVSVVHNKIVLPV